MQIDYKKIGLKSGLEIHQQLDTKKLFCNCPSLLRKDEPEFTISRKLHAVKGESGKIDLAAKYQSKLNREFIYQAYDSTCLVEFDEEPPHQINREALKIAIQIAILLNAKITPITQIMRKTVIDGSNTSGFQRTVMIAYDGFIKTKEGKVRIDTICLEEDSARKISEDEKKATFRLDRLGIPLIEIATAPDIKTPTQAKEAALKLGEILRSCKVKRGIGTIRQDVNVSIKGSNRVEIKGFQDPKIMIKTIDNEILRQEEIIKTKKNPKEVRNCLSDATTEFLRPMPGEARMYPETDLPLLKISRDFINKAKKDLPKLKSEIEKDLKNKGLSQDFIKLILKQNKLEEFKTLLNITNNPNLIGKMLFIFPKDLSKREKIPLEKTNKILNLEILEFILDSLNKKQILLDQIKQTMQKILKGELPKDAIKFEKKDLNEIEEKIMKIIKSKPGLTDKAYMGLVMKEFRSQISGAEAIKIIQKLTH